MPGPGFQLDCLLDPRLSPHAASPRPIWLWSADAHRILWANPTGAAIFGAASPAAAAALDFPATHPAAAQVARLATTLTDNGAPRLDRLRGFGARGAGTLTCACSRITLSGGEKAVLIVSTERAGPELTLAERAQRLLAENDAPVAAFAADGSLLHATQPIAQSFGDVTSLDAIGAAALAAQASREGAASGPTKIGVLSLARIGEGASTVLLATLDQPAGETTTDATITDAQISADASADMSADNDDHASPPAVDNVATAPAETPASVEHTVSTPRHPLRFVWALDDQNRFTLESQEFIALIGASTPQLLDRPWSEIAATLKLDPDGTVARAFASHETFSGITVPWPVDGSSATMPIELSGLPMFDRERRFRGYRGFGICRDVERLDALATARALLDAQPASPSILPPVVPPGAPPAETPQNVLRFPAPNAVTAERPADVFAPPEKPAEPAATPTPTLTPVEKLAFRELARRLGDGLKQPAKAENDSAPPPAAAVAAQTTAQATAQVAATIAQPTERAAPRSRSEAPILDRLPFGILVYRLNELLYANKAFLDWTGYAALYDLVQAGGLDTLFIDTSDTTPAQNGTPLTISTQDGDHKPVDGRLFSTTWNDESALVLMLNTGMPAQAPAAPDPRLAETEQALVRAQTGVRDLEAILDTATDGVVLIDRDGRVLSANRSAEALFGYDNADMQAFLFGDLFAPESRRAALDYLDRLSHAGATVLINEGREVIGRVRQGGLIPLFMTLGRVGDNGDKFCAVFRDVTVWKKTEEDLMTAKRLAEKTSAAKSEFLAKVSHDIRSPLNTIIGFSEVMIDERFGAIGNERYRDYLKDIHAAGEHLITLLNDLLDLSKIETGKLDLSFASLGLNDLVQQCVAMLQAQANRGRVIIRTALADTLPQVVADARSVRQIILNLLSNSLKLTGAGGQVIVSTALTDRGDVALRVRDTGSGMSEAELAQALEPFRELATTPRWGASGTGLGLPITKALAEANHAEFHISSSNGSGTLAEVVFPAPRLLAE